MRLLRILGRGAALAGLACGGNAPVESPIVLFLSDFGSRDGAVAACKGVMLDIAPHLRIVDVTHEVPAYDVQAAAEVLEQSLPYFAPGAVAVAVVDPGVGGDRRAMAARTRRGHLLVGPDNGIFTLVLQAEGLERAVELRNSRYFRGDSASSTFHGRDLFAPVAAHLAAGVPLDSLGPPIVPMRLPLEPARLTDDAIAGIVRYIEDPYGNVVTNVPPALLDSLGARPGDTLELRVRGRALRLPWLRTFSDVPRGAALALLHSRALLSFSVNQGDFAGRYGIRRNDSLTLRRAADIASPPR